LWIRDDYQFHRDVGDHDDNFAGVLIDHFINNYIHNFIDNSNDVVDQHDDNV